MTLFHGLGIFASSGAGAQGIDFITAAVVSGSGTVSINNCFSATYKHYVIMRNVSASSAGLGIRGRLRVAGADDTGVNYREQTLNASSTTVSSGLTTGADFWGSFLGQTQAISAGVGMVKISNPFDAVPTTAFNYQSIDVGGTIQLNTRVYTHDLATSYTGITLYLASGTMTGTFYVYGLVA